MTAKIKKVESRPLRRKDGMIIVDPCKFYRFQLPDGRVAETKAEKESDARKYIEECLNLKLEQAA